MNKKTQRLFDEMIEDFKEDILLEFNHLNNCCGFQDIFPLSVLNNVLADIKIKFNSLLSTKFFKFDEVAFRAAVKFVAELKFNPAMSIVDAEYIFMLALHNVGCEYYSSDIPLAFVA